MINAIIVDDEINGAEALQILLKEYCPDIHICTLAHSAQEGIGAIRKFNPQLVFLDIEMPLSSGFEVLSETKEYSYATIFTTAYSQYALRALKAQAIDYILKPIDADELMDAVKKATKKIESLHTKEDILKIEHLINKLGGERKRKISLSMSDGIRLINVDEIMRLEADSNYTHFYLAGNKKITVSRSLKEYEDQINHCDFVRVHNAHLINLNYVDTYVKGEGGTLILKDGKKIPVSRTKKQELLNHLFPDNS
jgi:two-component system LytT family response regulator